ncbi:MAG TPA: hypothetical protein VGE27_10745, partial [Gemmatimonas sp.]|uniref:hypothetical protein n=1 Tax=Gemmatimonas sp. TaxID=1962908 RepID=UPI002ED8FC94
QPRADTRWQPSISGGWFGGSPKEWAEDATGFGHAISAQVSRVNPARRMSLVVGASYNTIGTGDRGMGVSNSDTTHFIGHIQGMLYTLGANWRILGTDRMTWTAGVAGGTMFRRYASSVRRPDGTRYTRAYSWDTEVAGVARSAVTLPLAGSLGMRIEGELFNAVQVIHSEAPMYALQLGLVWQR